MPSKKLTSLPTEQDLESAISRVCRKIFKWLPRGSIKHQTTFSFIFGRKKVVINGLDGYEEASTKARADIILYNGDKPLAVLELKRPRVPLKDEDVDQGLSYARVLSPSAPLVIVTNGDDTRLVETHSGNKWGCGQHITEQAFRKLIVSAAKVAAGDIKAAIDTLMGTDPKVWQQAVRHASQEKLNELTVSHDNPTLPFVENFLIPRKATRYIIDQVSTGAKVILVEGPPMVGKSNVLREVVLQTETGIPDLATFYIEAGGGRSIFQRLAEILNQTLDWPVSVEEVRIWLQRLSKSNEGHKLLLAIDGYNINDPETRKEIEDLSSNAFGSGLAILVTIDDSVVEEVMLSVNRRSLSTIGRNAMRLKIELLDDQEFQMALEVLSHHRIYLMHGAHRSFEFRQPWVLRSIIGDFLDHIEQLESHASFLLPSILSFGLIRVARQRFTVEKLIRLFQKIATALLEDIEDHNRDPSLVLSTVEISLVRRAALEGHINDKDMQWLIDTGGLRSAIHMSDEPILYVGLPELLASEMARLIAKEYTQRRLDHQDAAYWLSGIAGSLPFGEVIVAQAMLDIIAKTRQLPLGLLEALLGDSPEIEQLEPGQRMLAHLSEDLQVGLTINQCGAIEVDIDGDLHTLDADENGLFESYSNQDAWLILSHFAAIPFAIDADGDKERIDPALLLELGVADFVLRRPAGHFEMRSLMIHDLPDIGSMVCHKEGIVEPITYAIFCFLKREDHVMKESWVDHAIMQESMPLLLRIHIALLQLSQVADEALSHWANSMIERKIDPAFKVFPRLN